MRNDYGIFFSYGNEVVRLPINPEELPDTLEADNTEYNVLGVGPITVPRIPREREVTISSYFPSRVDSSVLTPTQFRTPEFYLNFFRSAMNEKKVLTYIPARYMEDGTPFDTIDAGFQCIVMSFSVSEKGGETGDFYYDLTIREYRDYSPQVITIKAEDESGAVTVTSAPTRDVPSDQIVVGDKVIANGNFYLSSYGDEPHGTANNRTCVVTRIVTAAGRQYPIHIASESGGPLGWILKSGVRKI